MMSVMNDDVIVLSSDSETTVRPISPSPGRPFRFAAKKVLLTYAQCGEMTKEDVFHTLDERYAIQEYIVAEENHQDGGRHIHAAITFKAKVNARTVNCFDINTGDEQYHPNIKPIRHGKAHWDRATEYCAKDDPAPLSNIQSKLTYGEIFEGSTTPDEYLAMVNKHYPRDYALNFARLREFALAHFQKNVNTIENDDLGYEYDCPERLNEISLPMSKSLVIVGPAGCGKTSWAKEKAPKPALFIRHLDSLRKLNRSHKSIIFDDLDFKHLPAHSQKFLVDMENLAEIHVRYAVASIPAGVQRIFTANDYPFSRDDPYHSPAIERRLTLLDLNE